MSFHLALCSFSKLNNFLIRILMLALSLSLFSFLSFSLPTYSPFSVTFHRPGQLTVSVFFFPSLQPQISLSLSLSLLPTYSPFNFFHNLSRQTQIFISLSTVNQALFSYQFETLKLLAFSLPSSHQIAPDHTLEHFFTHVWNYEFFLCKNGCL